MQKLLIHIEYLIWRHECVILPGFGAFVVFLRPAKFDRESGIYYPPKREICFNPSIKNNDGLLTNSISRKEKISFEAASELQSRLLESLRQSLSKGLEISIGGVGSLAENSGGQILFTPLENREFLSEELPVIKIADAEREEKNNKYVAVERDDRFYHLRLDKRAVRAAAMLGVIVLAALSFILPGGMNLAVERASLLPTSMVSSKKVEKVSRTPRPDTAKLDRPATPVAQQCSQEVSTANKDYHLIVASLKTEKEVETFLSQHKGSEYKLRVIPGKSRIWISAEESDNSTELRALLNSTKFAAEYPGAWILKKSAEKN